MSHTALLRLTWPERPLWQNWRGHWSVKAKAASAYRTEAWAKAMEQSVKRINSASTPTQLRFTFHPPDRRKRDLQNLPATQKASIDGIADALGMDDSTFRIHWPTEWGEPVRGGCVMVEVSE